MSEYAKPQGCYTTDPTAWRGRTTTQWVQDGWRQYMRGDQMIREAVMRQVVTSWIPMRCGRLDQAGYTDNNCAGCAFDK